MLSNRVKYHFHWRNTFYKKYIIFYFDNENSLIFIVKFKIVQHKCCKTEIRLFKMLDEWLAKYLIKVWLFN